MSTAFEIPLASIRHTLKQQRFLFDWISATVCARVCVSLCFELSVTFYLHANPKSFASKSMLTCDPIAIPNNIIQSSPQHSHSLSDLLLWLLRLLSLVHVVSMHGTVDAKMFDDKATTTTDEKFQKSSNFLLFSRNPALFLLIIAIRLFSFRFSRIFTNFHNFIIPHAH